MGKTSAMSLSYLAKLLVRISAGLQHLSVERRTRHANYLRSMQQSDGGFPGRQGGSDLYYTTFALRSLALLGELDEGVAEQAAMFLRQRMRDRVPLVDLISLLFSAQILDSAASVDIFAEASAEWPDTLTATLGQFRRPDGGYAKTAEGAASGTYQTFLTMLVFELLGKPFPEPMRILDFVNSQRRDDGGFVEIRAMRNSGTNPTAAAVGTLRLLQSALDQPTWDHPTTESVGRFLLNMQMDQGGFRANTRIPMADLLSTFTALQSLGDLGFLNQVNIQAARSYAESLEQPGGGWYAAEWDDAIDVEYTFYGLGVLGLL